MLKKTKILFLIMLLLSSFEAKAEFQKGLEAYDAGNYEQAFKEWLESANSGDLAAQRNIGQLYRWGRGVEKSPDKAFYWYKKAADKGFSEAEFSLALMYLNGESVEIDEKMAVNLLKSAAKKGSYNAERKLVEISDVVKKIETEHQIPVVNAKIEDVKIKQEEIKKEAEALNIALKKVVPEEKVSEDKKDVETPVVAVDLKEDETKIDMVEIKNPPIQQEIKKTPIVEKKSDGLKKESINLVSKKELTAHLASYKEASKAEIGLKELEKKFKDIKNLKSSMKYVYIDKKGEFIRLYVTGNEVDIKKLCDKMKAKKDYCHIEKSK